MPTELLYSNGQDYLTTQLTSQPPLLVREGEERSDRGELRRKSIKFGLLSFFQINIPIFEQALEDISKCIDPTTPLVDYYSGVGSIGLTMTQGKQPCILIDNNEEAIHYARENISLNNFTNCEAYC